jgi:hypothetical protein
VKWLKCLTLVDFDDMWYDIGLEVMDLGFCLILFRFWKLDFRVSLWMNLLYGFQKRQAAILVFATPDYLKSRYFSIFPTS